MHYQASAGTTVFVFLQTKQFTLSRYLTGSYYAFKFAKPLLEDSKSLTPKYVR